MQVLFPTAVIVLVPVHWLLLFLHSFINFPPQFFYYLLHDFIIFPPHSWIPSVFTILIFPHLLLILFLILLLQNFYYFTSSILISLLLHLHLPIYSIYFSIHKYIDFLSTLHRPHKTIASLTLLLRHYELTNENFSYFLTSQSKTKRFIDLKVTRKPKQTKNSTRPYLNEIPAHFIHDKKTKDYDVIGVNVMQFLRKKVE